jgi:hypothetical protein
MRRPSQAPKLSGGSVNEIAPSKETVVRRRNADWSFHLPAGHEIKIDRENRHVSLSTPQESSTYELAGIEETGDEVIVALGQWLGAGGIAVGDNEAPVGYRLPEIQEEFERLRGRWLASGLSEQDFDAWAAGSSHEDKLREIRQRLREVGG